MTNPNREDINLHTIEIEIKDLYNQIEKLVCWNERLDKENTINTVTIEKLYQELDNVSHKYARLIASQIAKHPKK